MRRFGITKQVECLTSKSIISTSQEVSMAVRTFEEEVASVIRVYGEDDNYETLYKSEIVVVLKFVDEANKSVTLITIAEMN